MAWKWIIFIAVLFILFIAIFSIARNYSAKGIAVFGSGIANARKNTAQQSSLRRDVKFRDLVKLGPRTKYESAAIRAIESLTGKPFPTIRPSWLIKDGDIQLELDGYNPEIGIAIEVNGPLHTKPGKGDTPEIYAERIARDKFKRELCEKKGVKLIVVDYVVKSGYLRDYIESRLFDIGYFASKPANYTPEIKREAWISPLQQ
jgi:hypothetical protein